MTGAALVTIATAMDLMVRATLLIGAAWAAAAMLKRLGSSAAARHLAWLFCVTGLLALPLAWWLAPPLPLPILPLEVAAAAPAGPLSSAASAIAVDVRTGSEMGIAEWLLFAVYLAGATMLLLRLAASHVRVALLWREADPAEGADWEKLLARLSRDMGLSRPVELRIARRFVMPMTWGTLAPKILLPAEAHGWPAERRRFVLLHELAHVARRDSLARSAASLACAFYWPHPGAWLAARRLRLEQEHAADDRLLLLGEPPRGYALDLLELARRIGGKSRPEHAAAMAGAGQLERRVLAITTAARRDPPGHALVSAAAVAGTLVMLMTATLLPVRAVTGPVDLPRLEPLASSAGVAPAADERSALSPATALSREDRGPRGVADGGDAQRIAEPPPPVAAQPGQPEEVRSEPPPTGQAPQAGAGRQDVPVIASPRARPEVYGPRLSQQLATDDGLDPRIPQPLRSPNPRPAPQDDAAAGRATGHRILRGTLRVLERVLITRANNDANPLLD